MTRRRGYQPVGRGLAFRQAVPALLELELAQLRPARIGSALVAMLETGLVEVYGAGRAQPGAIRAAEHLARRAQRQRIAHPGGEIERLLLHVRAFELLAFAGPVDLVRVDRDGPPRILQTTHARPAPGRRGAQPQRR